MNLSKDSEELLIKILFTNSYPPKINMNSSDFLDFKLKWDSGEIEVGNIRELREFKEKLMSLKN